MITPAAGDEKTLGGKNKQDKKLTAAERDRLRRDDVYIAGKAWRRGSVPVFDLVPKIVDPIYARRGLASSQLVSAWPELVGSTFGECTIVEKIQWPRKHSNGTPSYQAGVLVVRIDGPQAIYFQHEEQQIIQRINRFFGFAAIERLKIVQGPIQRTGEKPKPLLPPLSPTQEGKLRDCLPRFDNPALNQAVLKMGRAVLRQTLGQKAEQTPVKK